MLTEQQQDGHLLYYGPAKPKGLPKRLIHLNGMASDTQKQLRDLEALVWMTVEHPVDILGVHNSTVSFQGDLLESTLGKAELVQFWADRQTPESQKRLQGYADALKALCDHDLPPDADILAAVQRLQRSLTVVQDQEAPQGFDLDLLRRLPFLQNMGWSDFESYLYGSYPAGAPRPTMRLAYEIIRAIRAGTEVVLVAHSQGTIVAALALHIVRQLSGGTAWADMLRFVGFGPVILFDDLPSEMRSQTILIQHRQDLIAESFSNQRNIDLWRNVQNQAKNLLEQADRIFQMVSRDSHHSASLYLGMMGDPAGDRSAQLIKLLLTENWETHPFIQPLRASRIVLEEPETFIQP
ncbi:MAG: hypothetical protein WA902_17480 [Thermosynechococcaceae cyanobacterium]